jgi:hypothetical protein
MKRILRFSVPDLEVSGLTIRFLSDGKIIAKVDNSDVHYTLHPGTWMGLIDLHRTNELLADAERYETLRTIAPPTTRREIFSIGIEPIREFASLLRPLRLGWMVRRRLGIGPRLLSGMNGVSVKRGPTDCNEPFKTLMAPPKFYEEVLVEPDRAYLLFDTKKPCSEPYGVMFTYRGACGFVHLSWFRNSDVRRWGKKWEPVFTKAWERILSNAA